MCPLQFQSKQTMSSDDDDTYSMWIINGCGSENVNGVYLECSNLSYANTRGFIFNPSAAPYIDEYKCGYYRGYKISNDFYKISNDGSIITQETPQESEDVVGLMRRRQEENEEQKKKKQAELSQIIATLNEEECKHIRDNYGLHNDNNSDDDTLNISSFINKYHITVKHIECIRKYIKHTRVLYKKNAINGKWECVNGEKPPPNIVKKLLNDKLTYFDNKNKNENKTNKLQMLLLANDINENILDFNCKQITELEEFPTVFCDFLSNLVFDIYSISNLTNDISNIILNFLCCDHNNIGMIRIHEDTKNYCSYTIRWVLFVCHICHKQWAAPKMTHWYEKYYDPFPCKQLMKYVTMKYKLQYMSRRGCLCEENDIPNNVSMNFPWPWNSDRNQNQTEMWKLFKQ
eukprot:145439_1